MANKKFTDDNTLDSTQIYDTRIGEKLSNVLNYTLAGHEGFCADLDDYTSPGVYPYFTGTAHIPTYGYGAILNILNWGTHKISTNWLWQIAFDTNNHIYIRTKINDGAWGEWKQII